MTPENVLASELRIEIEARLSAWKRERETLRNAVARIVELDALIAFAEDGKTEFKVAPRSEESRGDQ